MKQSHYFEYKTHKRDKKGIKNTHVIAILMLLIIVTQPKKKRCIYETRKLPTNMEGSFIGLKTLVSKLQKLR